LSARTFRIPFAVLALASCFVDVGNADDHLPCDSDYSCLNGFTCVAGYCEMDRWTADAGTDSWVPYDGAVPPDAAAVPPDATAVPPTLLSRPMQSQ